MAKRKRKPGSRPVPSFGGGGGGGGFGGGMAEKLQALQQQMAETQEALGDKTIQVAAGGGAINIEITGHQKITAITIDPEVLDPDDVEMVQDLIMAAVNEAIEQSQAMASQEMEGLTGGLNIPGLT